MNVKLIPAVILLVPLLAACGEPFDPCQVNPTRQAQDGTWVEADGEVLDDDPCDSDDFEGADHHRKTKKPTVTKPAVKPVPKSTRR